MSVATTWGTTPEERALPFACDGVIDGADAALWRAVSVDAPPAVVFRWLCQLRAAPYSYDWIDNRGRRSPQQLTPGLDDLAAGQKVMTIFRLVSFERDVQITVRSRGVLFGDVIVTYAVIPIEDSPQRAAAVTTRLVAKIIIRYPRGPIGWLMRLTLPWGDLIMMRKQLLNLKGLAEAR